MTISSAFEVWGGMFPGCPEIEERAAEVKAIVEADGRDTSLTAENWNWVIGIWNELEAERPIGPAIAAAKKAWNDSMPKGWKPQ